MVAARAVAARSVPPVLAVLADRRAAQRASASSGSTAALAWVAGVRVLFTAALLLRRPTAMARAPHSCPQRNTESIARQLPPEGPSVWLAESAAAAGQGLVLAVLWGGAAAAAPDQAMVLQAVLGVRVVSAASGSKGVCDAIRNLGCGKCG